MRNNRCSFTKTKRSGTKELSWRLESAEVARINAAAGEGQNSVSPAMAEWLGRCRQISEESAGAFDVSIGRLSRLWDIDTWAAAGDSGDYELPRQEEIAEALATTGWQKIQLEQQADGDSVSIPAEMQLDLGAVGKVWRWMRSLRHWKRIRR